MLGSGPALYLNTRALCLGALLWCASAAAIPAFARQYQVACSTCHEGTFPQLNAWGRQLKEQGYALPPGAEAPARERATLSPGDPAERLELFRSVPLSARATGSIRFPTNPRMSGRALPELSPLDRLGLDLGGSLYRRVSFFAAAEVAPTPSLPIAVVGVHDLFGEGVLNLRAGQLLLLDFLRPERREPTAVGNPIGTVRVGQNPSTLDSSQLGLEAYGRLFSRHLFWELAVVQGATLPGSWADLDGFKDVFAQLQLEGELGGLGAFGYLGRTQVLDTARATAVRFTDPFWVAGAQGQLRLGSVTAFAWLLAGNHQNPDGWGTRTDYLGARVQLDALLRRDLVATVRGDAVLSSLDATLERRYLTGALSFLALGNLKVSAEAVATLHAVKNSTVYLRVDLAL